MSILISIVWSIFVIGTFAFGLACLTINFWNRQREEPGDMKQVICQKELPNGLIVWTREWRNMNSPEFDEVFTELDSNHENPTYIVHHNQGRHANIKVLNNAYSRPELPCKPE
tara:strand:- start:9563 stop:9901 length:339 start_codon:yes stop_codon:yes gene_type:complete